eukprot:CAMPEP_0202445892 /NCGR_PEP_ID=MMETSP1360-20130828/4609_1 /ASSEMBLY_ACC=CAM_ASM_000848 /TAXON_ID=515479 /ORGANISM="Licmophora paradoxa, Strain CCMP2313" /LENGTH=413 /DNA_ID=CAMNT_0049062297 /DNA_START=42 /DNA_END=1283 /DNA_ORIENTATION=-
MGKKAKSSSGIAKAADRKIDKSTLPPPPPPPEEEYGSSKPLDAPSLPGNSFKILDSDGYDDGGVADLSLLIDLEDNVQRRRRGDAEYFTALKQDLLPRATKGNMAKMTRREQKVQLAQLLFSEDDQAEDKGPSEVFMETASQDEDETVLAHRRERLAQAKLALRMSLLLREPACTSLSLSELCKRRLALFGKDGAPEALRCAERALEITQDGFWDNDEVAVEAEDVPRLDPKYEKNATAPGLAHPTSLKLLPIRVSDLCKRSALLQRGNALAAMGKQEQARDAYTKVFPLLEKEPRCSRVDWERHSLYINIGNTHSREGQFTLADEQYKIAEQLGNDHIKAEEGSKADGAGMVNGAKRARAFALKKSGKEDEAKALLREVIASQIKLNEEEEAKKKKEAEEAAAAEAAAKPAT